MKLNHKVLESCRVKSGDYASPEFAKYGAFRIACVTNGPENELHIIADNGELSGWEHVSVSAYLRTPTWEEMCYVKSLFFAPNECVVQFHPPESEYVNQHEHCLHLWRCLKQPFPRPERILV